MASQSNYFAPLRLCCSHCGKEGVKPDALVLLNALRIIVGRPIRLTSAYRCKDHPIEVLKDKPGQHNKGHAFDLYFGPDEALKNDIMETAPKLGFLGIGVYDTFIHIDLRTRPASW